MARPKAKIDEQQVRELAAIDCTSAEMAAVLRCNEGTLLRRFAGVIKEGRLAGKMSLRRKQFQVAMAGNVQKAMEIQFKLMPMHKNLFVEANPIPVKWAMARMGLCGGTLRMPMTELSKSQQPVVEAALRASGLI